MTRSVEFDRELIATLPAVETYMLKLSRNRAIAEDMKQLTAAKAIAAYESYAPGTNMKAWLFTIARHEYFSMRRKGKREVADVDGIFASVVPTPGAQDDSYDLKIMLGQLGVLDDDQRLTFEMVALDGMSYEEVARLMGLAEGTVKSRVSRIRAHLASIYEGKVPAFRA